MSRINVHSSRARGFTLVELMISLSLLAIVLGGVLAAYLFLGRNLARLVNVQQQQVQSRRALRIFTQDLSTASQLTTATSTQIALAKPVASGTATISYSYTPPSPSTAANGALTRTETIPPAAATTQTVLSGLTAFAFNFYSNTGVVVTSGTQSVKTAEFTFTSAAGNANAVTQTNYTSVSPRVVLRNKSILQ